MKQLPLLTAGEILRDDFLVPMEISAYRLAKHIDVPLSRISAILNGKRAITADTGLRLDKYFGLSEGYWMRIQLDCDIRKAKREIGASLAQIKPRDLDAA